MQRENWLVDDYKKTWCDPSSVSLGAVCTVVQVLYIAGTLKPGAYLVANTAYGKVKGLFDENKKSVKTAEPGTAVEVVSWKVSKLYSTSFIFSVFVSVLPKL